MAILRRLWSFFFLCSVERFYMQNTFTCSSEFECAYVYGHVTRFVWFWFGLVTSVGLLQFVRALVLR